jgi:hypothetical protein
MTRATSTTRLSSRPTSPTGTSLQWSLWPTVRRDEEKGDGRGSWRGRDLGLSELEASKLEGRGWGVT